MKVCKECKNTLKQLEGSNRYYCDKCWNPYWEDQLTDGICAKCQDNEYAGNPNWAGDD